jgi:hypothetical protein
MWNNAVADVMDEFAFVGLNPERLRMRHKSGHEFEFIVGPAGRLGHGQAGRITPNQQVSVPDGHLAYLEAMARGAVTQLLATS